VDYLERAISVRATLLGQLDKIIENCTLTGTSHGQALLVAVTIPETFDLAADIKVCDTYISYLKEAPAKNSLEAMNHLIYATDGIRNRTAVFLQPRIAMLSYSLISPEYQAAV
jgi:hypothetical protein